MQLDRNSVLSGETGKIAWSQIRRTAGRATGLGTMNRLTIACILLAEETCRMPLQAATAAVPLDANLPSHHTVVRSDAADVDLARKRLRIWNRTTWRAAPSFAS